MASGNAGLNPKIGGWLANAATALFIAIASGVAVWWLTKPDSTEPGLGYQVVNTGTFDKQGQRLSFFTVKLVNDGNTVAKEVTLNLQTSTNSAMITDASITTSPSRPKFNLQKLGRQRLLVIPQLRPTERINVSLAVESAADVDLKVFGVAENAKLKRVDANDAPETPRDPWTLFLIVSVSLAGNAIGVTLVRKFIRRKFRKHEFYAELNNIAFLLMHAGSVAIAKKLFEQSFGDRNGEISLSNYALALALDGDMDNAKAVVGSIDGWVAKFDPHSAKVHNLNKDIILALDGQVEAKDRLRSVMQNELDLHEYLKNSLVIRQRIPEIYTS